MTTPLAPATDPAIPADTPPAASAADPEPADIAGYQALVTKLRDEVKTAKADRTPQADKDARTIAALKRQLDEAAPKLSEYDRLVAASQSDLEREQAARQKADARITALVTRTVRAEIKAAATGFADPSDAAAFLDTAKYANDDGEIDTDAIKTDLAALLAAKPHLAAQTGRQTHPNPAQGSGEQPPIDIDQQIRDAEKTGNFALSIALKRMKAAQAVATR